MWKESVVAHFKALHQHLTGGISNVKLGIPIKAKLSQGLVNHTMRSEVVEI
jgi:hypothetical protein